MQSKEHHNCAVEPCSAAAKMVKMADHLIQTIITADEDAHRTTVVLRSLGAELFGLALAFDATLTNLEVSLASALGLVLNVISALGPHGQILDNSCHLKDFDSITLLLYDEFSESHGRRSIQFRFGRLRC